MEHTLRGTEKVHLERFAEEWSSLFSEPKSHTCGLENTPFWRRPEQDPVTSRELLEAFLKDLCDDTDPYLYRAVEIESFCLPADLGDLKNGGCEQVHKPMALLDDRNDEGTRTAVCGTCRTRKGALSAHQLYHELNKPRYVNRTGTSAVQRPESTRAETDEPDADRRLIYVADVDRWCILAIIATASTRQSGYFKDFIYRHLAFKTFLGVQIPSIGLRTFALEFHFPLYAWRRGSSPIQDRRQRGHGKPLRRSRDLNFLNLAASDDSGPKLEDCIYEVQISCIITGFDERSWVALQFVDTYYKGDEENRESVEFYAEQSENSSYNMDPLTQGRFDANIPIWKPREYFLVVMECRIDQVRQEWHNVVSRLLQILQPYTHDYLLPTDDQSPDHTEKYNKRVQRFSNRTIRFLHQVISHLSKTIDAWDSFQKGDLGYFSRLESFSGQAGSYSRLLLTVEKHIAELRDLRREVEDQKHLMESIEREVTQHLQQESNKIANLQQQSGEHMKLLTRIALIFTPITISSGLFSVDGDTLPFPKSPQTYFLITLCLGVIMLVLSTVMLNWGWHHGLRDWVFPGRQRGKPREFERTNRRGGREMRIGNDGFARLSNDIWEVEEGRLPRFQDGGASQAFEMDARSP